jgi:hypothetical protein
MERRIQMLADDDTDAFSMAALCRCYGVSRDTFYSWKERRAEGNWFADRARDLPSGKVGDNLAIFTAGLEDTVAAIRATGREVAILGGLPEVGWSVPEALARSRTGGAPLPPAPTAAEVERRDARSAAVMAALGTRPGVRYLPLAAAFCTPACVVEDAAGRPVYVDDDHLSRTGAETYLAPLLARTLWPEREAKAADGGR